MVKLDENAEFIVHLMSALHEDTNSITNSLIESLQKESDDLRGIIIEVREALSGLFSCDYVPSEGAIENAVRPLYYTHNHFWRDREEE
jgi:hypothetical protein